MPSEQVAEQQTQKTSSAWHVAARDFSYTAEATAMFSDPATSSELARLQLADVGPIKTGLTGNHLAAAPHLKANSGARLLLLFARSVLEPEVVPEELCSIRETASRATSNQQNVTLPSSAPDCGSSSAIIPPVMCDVALLRTALLTVKAAALLDIGDTTADRHSNTDMLWQTAEFLIGSMRDDTVTLPETEFGAYATRSAKEAEHLSVLLVQVLLQGMSQYLSQVASLRWADTCCKLLDALLATNQQGVSQPLTNVVAAEIAHQSEFLVQSVSQFSIR